MGTKRIYRQNSFSVRMGIMEIFQQMVDLKGFGPTTIRYEGSYFIFAHTYPHMPNEYQS